MSHLEREFVDLWLHLFPDIDLHSEHRFHPARRWRFDFAHLPSKVAIEINGGTWIQSGHTTGTGLARDYEKLNAAVLLGWRVFQLSEAMITEENLRAMAALMQSKS